VCFNHFHERIEASLFRPPQARRAEHGNAGLGFLRRDNVIVEGMGASILPRLVKQTFVHQCINRLALTR
jgi:hypothetical protein